MRPWVLRGTRGSSDTSAPFLLQFHPVVEPHPTLRAVLGRALARSARTGWFLVRIMVPLSAGIGLLQWTGTLEWIGRRLAPAMGLFGLPGEAAVALVAGAVTGVYGGVAAAAAVPLTKVQLTVLALMVLTAHNLVVESAVQSRSGTSGLRVSAVRVATGLLLGALLWQTLGRGDAGAAAVPSALPPPAEATFAAFAAAWARGAAYLVLKVGLILLGLMIATELMRAYGVIDALVRPVRPIVRFLGLSERVSFLWLTAIFLGIAYGAGLIIQDAAEPGRFRPGDLRDLHVSIGLCHSVLEDTVLFVAIGASPFWILAPRPIAAALVVRAVRRLVPARPVALRVGGGAGDRAEERA